MEVKEATVTRYGGTPIIGAWSLQDNLGEGNSIAIDVDYGAENAARVSLLALP